MSSKTDSWKRPIQGELPVEYPTQPQLLFRPAEATQQEIDEWQEKELNWWADRQFNFIIIATIIQISALGFMASVMYFNSIFFS